jgi:hypothetical protein
MSSANTLFSYVIGSRVLNSSDKLNVGNEQLRRFAARERSVNDVEDFISKYYWPTFPLAVLIHAATNSGVFDYVEAPGDESWNY